MTARRARLPLPPVSLPSLRLGRFEFAPGRPLVMGVVNVTPDSFSDGGRFFDAEAAAVHAAHLADEGADILDLGGESTRPGAAPVSEAEEIDRVLPVLERVLLLGRPVSVDTRRAGVMRAALAAGAAMVNDVQALTGPGTLEAVTSSDAGVCLMHMRGMPADMQTDPRYEDVVREVRDFLAARAAACEAAGIDRARIVIDPGIGFGKTLEHNLELTRGLPVLAALGLPVLVGWSRKSSLGRLTGRAVGDRLPASLAAALFAVRHGARILRVHDVAATRDALAVWQAAEAGEGGR